jgi:plasmid stabilization system protein ParE
MEQPLWSAAADAELDEILYFIAVRQRRPESAARLFWEIHDATAAHLNAGRQGHAHTSFPINLRYLRHKRWLIVYEPTKEGMIVHRIIDASRDLPTQFEGDA